MFQVSYTSKNNNCGFCPKSTATDMTKTTKHATPAPVSKDELLKYYRDMLLIRRFEERAGQLYGMGEIAGFCHLYIGQEGVVTGIQSQLSAQDSIITTYRDHGHMLACGMDPKGVMAELTGRSGGYSKGKGGSMHMFSKEKNFYGGHGIVGASVSLGTGLAFAHHYRGDGGICANYFGDGAANQGQVYESFNMAALWKLPVLFIIENNQYAMGTSTKRHTANPHFFEHGRPWGIPGKQVNGQDVLAVRDAAREAIDYIRAGNGPMLLEMMTYRYRGHSMSDPAKYRTKEEVDEYKHHKDPIEHAKERLESEFKVSEEALKAIDKEIREIIKEAVDFSLESPEPELSELYTDILIEAPETSHKLSQSSDTRASITQGSPQSNHPQDEISW